MAELIGRGRGRGRGLGKGWIETFQPNSMKLTAEDIDTDKYKDVDSDNIHQTEDNKYAISERLVEGVLDEKESVLQCNNNAMSYMTLNDEKPTTGEKPDQNKKTNIEASSVINKTKSKGLQQFDPVLLKAVYAPEFDPLLLKAVHAPEFIPATFSHIPQESYDETWQYGYDEGEIAITVLNDSLASLLDDPGDFDNIIGNLSEHLKNFVTKAETLQEIVSLLVNQALEYPSSSYGITKLAHYFNESKCLELEDGSSFRKLFFKRIQEKYLKVDDYMQDLSNPQNLKMITNTAMLFGELCCNMKLSGKTIPLLKKTVFKFVDMFLEASNTELLLTLTRLLKLVGPDLDIDRPKDVEAVYEKIKDFYFDRKKTEHLPPNLKDSLWRVYKLHSRDWDRQASEPPSPAASSAREPFVLPSVAQQALQQKRKKSFEVEEGVISAEGWNDYYTGDDSDVYQNYMNHTDTDDEEFEAYEEFLRMSGQM